MVIGPPYDCRVTFDDRTDLIVFYCIRRPTTPTGTFEARVFQTIPIFFPFSFFFFLSFFLSSFPSSLPKGERELRNDIRNVSRNWFEGVYFHQGDTTIALEISRFLPSFSFFFFTKSSLRKVQYYAHFKSFSPRGIRSINWSIPSPYNPSKPPLQRIGFHLTDGQSVNRDSVTPPRPPSPFPKPRPNFCLVSFRFAGE